MKVIPFLKSFVLLLIGPSGGECFPFAVWGGAPHPFPRALTPLFHLSTLSLPPFAMEEERTHFLCCSILTTPYDVALDATWQNWFPSHAPFTLHNSITFIHTLPILRFYYIHSFCKKTNVWVDCCSWLQLTIDLSFLPLDARSSYLFLFFRWFIYVFSRSRVLVAVD